MDVLWDFLKNNDWVSTYCNNDKLSTSTFKRETKQVFSVMKAT